jgi:H+/Cl- antiporter ClcA
MLRDSSLTGETETTAINPQLRHEESRRLILFSAFGALMGIIGAVAAWALYHLIMIFTGIAFYHTFSLQTPLYPPTENIGAAAIIIPVIGGLIVGVIAKYGSDRIKGHGIPEAMEAVLRHKARVSPRIAIFKPISAAIAVGTGGPFGAEGPIIQTGGAIGSLIGQSMRMTTAERRTLLACGGAAGMVGIFNTPIAGVALALELLLFEFRARSLVPVIIASAVAAAVRTVLLGGNVMFAIGKTPGIGGPLDVLWFVPLGIIVGLGAVIFSKGLTWVEEFFERLSINPILKPAIGALILGIIAFFQPLVLGMGYPTITKILENGFGNGTLIGLSLGKAVALIASLGSGTSGGLLAPMLLVGAGIGSIYGRGITSLFPAAGINPGICGVVAMSSLFSAAARAPLTSFVFAFELTGDYKAIVPLMVGCMIADIVARSLTSESVMTERLVKRGLRIDQGYEPNLLGMVSVSDVMTRTIDTLRASTPLPVALRGLLGEPLAHSLVKFYGGTIPGDAAVSAASGSPNGNGSSNGASNGIGAGPEIDGKESDEGDEGVVCAVGLHQRWMFPVVDDDGKLVGVITRGDLLNAAAQHEQSDCTVGDLATKDLVVAHPSESLQAAVTRMLAHDFAALPVVDQQQHNCLVGVLGRSDVLRARLAYVRDETQRERSLRLGLLRRYRPTGGYDERVRETDALAHAEQSSFDLTAPGTGAPPAESEAIAAAAATAPVPDAPETAETSATTGSQATEKTSESVEQDNTSSSNNTSSSSRPHSSP